MASQCSQIVLDDDDEDEESEEEEEEEEENKNDNSLIFEENENKMDIVEDKQAKEPSINTANNQNMQKISNMNIDEEINSAPIKKPKAKKRSISKRKKKKQHNKKQTTLSKLEAIGLT